MKLKYDITFHPSWYYKNADISFNEELFDDPETRILADIKMRETLFNKFGEYDIGEKDPKTRPLLGTNLLAAGYLYSEILGCDIEYAGNNSPVVIPQNLSIDRIHEIDYTTLCTSEVWNRTQVQLDFLKSKYGEVYSFINLMGVQNIAMDIMGQNLMTEYFLHPEKLEYLFETITKCIIDVGRKLKEYSTYISAGVTNIISKTKPDIYLTSNCSVEMISNQVYIDNLLKYDIILAEEFGNFGVHHCGLTMEHVILGYARIPNLKFVEAGAGSDVKTIRQALPYVHINARVSPVDLMAKSTAELKNIIEKLIYHGNNYNGAISVSCVGIDDNVEDEKIVDFLRICDEISWV